jgi:PAS domain S-box-containing protein
MSPPLGEDERRRLAELRRYGILDTPPEAAFDRITRLTAHLLQVPIAQVTLVDEQRQWFKSSHGLDATETPRDVSFCAHAILSDEVMVVPDATHDSRFAANALVTGEPRIRFYAGAPLKSAGGANLGTLCAIDTKPRQLTPRDTEMLRDLAALACDELELRLALRERDQQMTAIRNLTSGVLITDADPEKRQILFANPGFSAITGYPPEEVIGRNCRFLQGPETDCQTVTEMRRALESRSSFHGVLLNYRKNGTPFWNELSISPVFNPDGELINFVGLQSDVTERKRTSDQLRESFDKLQQLEALRDNLTQMMVHDLRSPLGVVMGLLHLLQKTASGKLDAKERECIAIARNSAGQMQELITQLLDVTRLEEGHMPLSIAPCDLAEILRATAGPAQRLEAAERLQLELPEGGVQVLCDAELIRRVIGNLVGNAIKFTAPPGMIRVSIAADRTGAQVRVSDTGPGISEQDQPRIFDKFAQVESARGKHSTGLGLTFCKLAVEAQGGSIGVESTPGKGSSFWFTLNLA